MKFFSELGSCWGGAMVTPAAEPAGVHSQRRRTSKRPAKLSGAAAHWRPKLNAISENSPMFDEKKRPQNNTNTKSTTKAASRPSLAEDYWNFSQTMALPAFSPTSYF